MIAIVVAKSGQVVNRVDLPDGWTGAKGEWQPAARHSVITEQQDPKVCRVGKKDTYKRGLCPRVEAEDAANAAQIAERMAQGWDGRDPDWEPSRTPTRLQALAAKDDLTAAEVKEALQLIIKRAR